MKTDPVVYPTAPFPSPATSSPLLRSTCVFSPRTSMTVISRTERAWTPYPYFLEECNNDPSHHCEEDDPGEKGGIAHGRSAVKEAALSVRGQLLAELPRSV